ncbi:BrnT family toxin [Telmatospirillum siberiense]|uniref:BrnT family toxin n=1 Tax=Telmatospirillum siberiense TaxID=382514 RepID=A0A2N3PXZ5_9PROT|nr:BrnT family toxin [Telmatospirillum siberiense]PKU25259.1 BrnT family toxin [Telmatospirillum siberiense]
MTLRLSWDEPKRAVTLAARGLDFADAGKLFAGDHFTQLDDRRDYGEPRYITAGWLDGRFVVLVWTPRDGGRRIISMRYGHADEEAEFRERMG